MAEAPSESRIVLDDEHDRFAWLPLAEVVARCRPASVGVGVTNAAGWLDARSSA